MNRNFVIVAKRLSPPNTPTPEPSDASIIRRVEKNYIPEDVVFNSKPQIALELIDRAKANGIEVEAWTADELYGRSGPFLDGLDERGEAFAIDYYRVLQRRT